ncbi:hypothetical protein X741_26805 [Mesorhizobium sp. LNHC229A00]|nr:hypothetical protein X741_26805 [Mesorhizobium sp. LNHC229A00]
MITGRRLQASEWIHFSGITCIERSKKCEKDQENEEAPAG